MGVYDRAVATAYRLVLKYGRDITVVKGSETPTNAAQPWRGSDSEYTAATAGSEVETKGVFVHPASITDFGFVEVSAEMLHKRGAKVCLVAASGLVDLSEHEGVRDGTEAWRIEKVHIFKPGATTILYAFEVAQ